MTLRFLWTTEQASYDPSEDPPIHVDKGTGITRSKRRQCYSYQQTNPDRTEDEKCYYEIEKHEFFTKDGKKDAKWDLIKHGECAWSSEAFDYHLKPIWEGLIAEHKADDYFVDDWNEHPELEDLA